MCGKDRLSVDGDSFTRRRMKINPDQLKKESLHHLELSCRDKDSVVNSDLQKMNQTIKSLAKKKDLLVLVLER